MLVLCLSVVFFVSLVHGEQQPLQLVATSSDWEVLSSRVGGRLHPAEPFSKPCYEDGNSEDCRAIRKGYGDDGDHLYLTCIERSVVLTVPRRGLFHLQYFGRNISAHSESSASNLRLSWARIVIICLILQRQHQLGNMPGDRCGVPTELYRSFGLIAHGATTPLSTGRSTEPLRGLWSTPDCILTILIFCG